MLKVVLDTNVVVSAAIHTDGAPALLLSLALEGRVKLFVSPALMVEYESVLKRKKFGLRHKDVFTLMREIKNKAKPVNPSKKVKRIKEDDADNRILECALEAGADCIVTGNRRHFPFESFRGINILSPRDLLSRLGADTFLK